MSVKKLVKRTTLLKSKKVKTTPRVGSRPLFKQIPLTERHQKKLLEMCNHKDLLKIRQRDSFEICDSGSIKCPMKYVVNYRITGKHNQGFGMVISRIPWFEVCLILAVLICPNTNIKSISNFIDVFTNAGDYCDRLNGYSSEFDLLHPVDILYDNFKLKYK